MTSETNKAKTKLASLSTSLDELEAQLEPIFSQTLAETIVGLEPIQQAKLQTVLPYLVYDLIFIYLKTRGIDPKTHPVVPELDRIRQYFEKISTAENPPAKRTTGIDKAAASRFIKHAVTQAQWTKTAAEEPEPEPSTSKTRVPVKVTSKMAERAQYEKDLKERDAEGSEEDDLEVFADEDADNDTMEIDSQQQDTAAKGKAKAANNVNEPSTTVVSGKRRRPAIDPFTGYGEDPAKQPAPETPSPSESTDIPSKQGRTRKKKSGLSTLPDATAPGDPASGTGNNGLETAGSGGDDVADELALPGKPKTKKKGKKKAKK